MPNPFSLPDVPDPTGPDVQAFARDVPVAEFAGDENAMAWVTITTESNGLDGAWSSRWRTSSEPWQQGVATVSIQGDRVHILFKDSETYLLQGVRQGDRVIGRSVNVADPDDTSPWVGILVNPYRIDGYWSRGRWDFRRCSPDERPEPIVAAVLTEARQLNNAQLRELLGFARYLRWRGIDNPPDEP
jgi:hypothetical protein